MKVLIISTHPDDETLACGGTALRHHHAGDETAWLIMTNVFEKEGFGPERVRSRQEEIRQVASRLKFSKVFELGYPTMKLDQYKTSEIIKRVSDVMHEFTPDMVYLPNRSDAHSDHRITFTSVMACTKSFRYPFLKSVLMYECISETEFTPPLQHNAFVPNYFVDISEYIDTKLDTLKIYASELDEHPFPRSLENVKALAIHRGASCGVKYAEAFQMLKTIVK